MRSKIRTTLVLLRDMQNNYKYYHSFSPSIVSESEVCWFANSLSIHCIGIQGHSTIMGRLTQEQKAKIVRLRLKNKNILEIVRILADDECQTSRLSVRRFLRRFQERQSLENAPIPGRPVEQVTCEVLNFVDAEMEKNDELTAPHFRKKNI